MLALLAYLADPSSDLRAAAFLRSRFVRLSDEALKRLAPGSAGCARTPADRRSRRRWSARIAARADAARRSLARWLALVDRLPPAELLDRVLAETAYACELRGRGWRRPGRT